ncbi:tyrosine-protein kinase Etk/Wzc [Rahnella sp. BIGb0236]|uniref:polysaccharide biosynthesis tyrosine autokinase n=1 Tax=Rahnella sp. BIGb0236 TaxID=2485117 RepID=UPI00105E4FFD|nr:polysaccharide biosynthesis tyrosine autokinase [Rahnella sp. BIGb0236]TDS86251.1 tyrosine-protein kinase Etk/Wzc [Rahnella sp. BIGb0236]
MIGKSESKSGKQNACDELDLRKIVGFLIDRIRTIVMVTAAFSFTGLLYAFLSTPVYHADALVQVEPANGNSVMRTLSELLPAETPVSAREIQLITSRTLIGKTVAQLNLDTQIGFNGFPFLGNKLHRLMSAEVPKLQVERFETTDRVTGEIYTLENLGRNQYRLTTPSGAVAQGNVGERLKTPELTLQVTQLRSSAGDTFSLQKRDVSEVIGELQKRIQIRDQGKDTGLLTINITGSDPEQIKNIVQKVSENYAEQSIQRKSEQAEKSLGFLKTQLPVVREKLDKAETKLNLYRSMNNSVDLTLEAKSMLENMVQLDGQINQLILKETEVSKLYTKQHPAYSALREKIQVLENDKNALAKKVDKLPLTQQEILRLTRDVQSGQIVYMQLMDKEQELNISKASTIGTVHIIDPATTARKPVNPGKFLIILVFTFLGAVSSVIFILAKTALIRGVNSAEMLEDIGLNVFSSVPVSLWQHKKHHTGTKSSPTGGLLALENPADCAIEALRNLRTSLHFTMLEAGSKVLMISGASPDVGKTFISSNLAAVITQVGKKVLYIDADMRRGYSHILFNKMNEFGLSDILAGTVEFSSAIHNTAVEGLDIITRGKIPRNPSELLLREECAGLLEWASKKYDVIILDVPPILAVTDAAIIGKYAGVSLLVAKFEMSTVREMESSIQIFARHNISVSGVILNSVINRTSNYYNYGKYAYYKYESASN